MSIEAMKQVLDALEIGYESVKTEAVETWAYVGYRTAIYAEVEQIADAITTLRAAIQQAEETHWKLSCGCPSQYGGIPAEWATTDREGSPAIAYGVICEKHWHEYDAQHPKVWQGLTDEERKNIWSADQMFQEEWDELFDTVEAKLKEKNK